MWRFPQKFLGTAIPAVKGANEYAIINRRQWMIGSASTRDVDNEEKQGVLCVRDNQLQTWDKGYKRRGQRGARNSEEINQ